MLFKRCFKCLLELPLSAFYKHSRMSDGHLNKCIDCTKKDCSDYRQANLERVRAYDKSRASMPHRVSARKEYAKTDRGSLAMKKARRAYMERYPDRREAHVILGNAIRDGRVTPWPVCAVPDCEEVNVEGHHFDYSQPLEVTWLCIHHHQQLHKDHREAA